MPALHRSLLKRFYGLNAGELLGELVAGLAAEGFDTNRQTADSWQREITDLKLGLSELGAPGCGSANWTILLEYVVPIVGQRLDCVLIGEDVIYVLEYKAGSSVSAASALRQAQEYALNLADFHECSRGRTVVPIAIGQFARCIPLDLSEPPQRGAAISPQDVARTIQAAHVAWSRNEAAINPTEWERSRYFPVPTIIEAASAIYRDHDVTELARSRSGDENLRATQEAIANAVREAQATGSKKLVVVTGVPGAGKTLAGLNIIQRIQGQLDAQHEQAGFLSGNGPLVNVLREALKRSVARRQRGVARAIQSRIREMHRFVKDLYGDDRPPPERLIVFDEAQRAWSAAKNLRKFNRAASEPEMILDIMGRHKGWAVVVALVGGGQEIHRGEAGLGAWGTALGQQPGWGLVSSPEALDGSAAMAGGRLFSGGPPPLLAVQVDSHLHLAISRRSFATEVTAAWVNAVLSGNPSAARQLAQSEASLPMYVSRDLGVTRRWLRGQTQGRRRCGLIASSGAARLRAHGLEPPTFSFLKGIDYAKWFLEPDGDFRSSNHLEVALSEFELQGLELDWTGLVWGGDLVFSDHQIVTRRLRGTKWTTVAPSSSRSDLGDDPRVLILNKYRVLLTRFRKGMVVVVPDGSMTDETVAKADYDSVYDYLIECGIRQLP